PPPSLSPLSTLFPYTTLFRSQRSPTQIRLNRKPPATLGFSFAIGFHLFTSRTRQKRQAADPCFALIGRESRNQSAHAVRIKNGLDRKSTRLNSSHGSISYAVF